MAENVSILKVCDEIINKLQNRESVAAYFKQDLDFFSDRIKTWTQRKTRVGLIGITSSGKSTLLNSILGEELLPARIGPTSNVITIGEYGDRLFARIIYQEGSDIKEKIIEKNILQELTKLTEQNFEKDKEFKVKEVYVHSPNFKLSKEISIIDTPGLAAYGFDEHEEITFQLGLPLMDIIIFMTTFRTYNDQENLKRIKQIQEFKKPILLVQNMIDTIYPKYDKYGKVIKDVKEILEEHKQKFYGALKDIGIENYADFKIAQISSLEALKGNRENSNFNELSSLLNDILMKVNENVYIQRVSQINTRIDQILTQMSNLRDKGTYLKFEEEKIHNLTATVENLQEEIEKKINQLSEKVKYFNPEAISDQVLKLNKKTQDVSKAQETISTFIQKMLKPINQDLLNLIKEANEKLFNIASEINLMPQDLNSEIYSYQEIYSFSIPVKAVTYTVTMKVPKEGIANAIIRFIGKFFKQDWGYEEKRVNKTEIRIDEQRAKTAIIEKLEEWEEWFKNAVEKLIINSENYFYKIRHEIYKLTLSIQNKTFLELSEEDCRYVLDVMESAKEQIEEISDGKVKGIDIKEIRELALQKYKEIEIPSFFSYLIELASLQSFKPLYFLRDFALERLNNPKNIIVWGWDNEEINSFINLYFSELMLDSFYVDVAINHIRLSEGRQLITVNENTAEEQIYDYLNLLKDPSSAFFLLIDISQSGFTKTKIMKSLLKNLEIKKVCWIAISINAVLNSDKLLEGFKEFQKLVKEAELPSDFILACDKDAFYSVLFAEVFYYFENTNNSIFEIFSENEIRKIFEPFVGKNEFKKKTLENFISLIKSNLKEASNYA